MLLDSDDTIKTYDVKLTKSILKSIGYEFDYNCNINFISEEINRKILTRILERTIDYGTLDKKEVDRKPFPLDCNTYTNSNTVKIRSTAPGRDDHVIIEITGFKRIAYVQYLTEFRKKLAEIEKENKEFQKEQACRQNYEQKTRKFQNEQNKLRRRFYQK